MFAALILNINALVSLSKYYAFLFYNFGEPFVLFNSVGPFIVKLYYGRVYYKCETNMYAYFVF